MSQFPNQPSSNDRLQTPIAGLRLAQSPRQLIKTTWIFVFVVGVLLVFAAAWGKGIAETPPDEFIAIEQKIMTLPEGMTWDKFREQYIVIQKYAKISAPILVGFGTLQLMFATWIRRGKIVACELAIVLTLGALALTAMLFVSLLKNATFFASMAVILLAILAGQLAMLILLRNSLKKWGLIPISAEPMPLPGLMVSSRPDDILPEENPYHVPPVSTGNSAVTHTGWHWSASPPPPPPTVSPANNLPPPPHRSSESA